MPTKKSIKGTFILEEIRKSVLKSITLTFVAGFLMHRYIGYDDSNRLTHITLIANSIPRTHGCL